MVKAQKDKVATESFVLKVVDELRTEMNTKFEEVDRRFQELNQKIDQKFDSIMNVLDSLMGQFKKFDEELTILSDHVRGHSDRIEKLENKVFKSS